MTTGQLTSWKEIAAYLNCSVRTVQRWEKERGLPVRRLPGDRGGIYALIDEIDAWKSSARAPRPGEEDPELLAAEANASSSDLLSAPAPVTVTRRRGWPVVLALTGILALLAIATWRWSSRDIAVSGAEETPIRLGATAVVAGGLDGGAWPMRGMDSRRTYRALHLGPSERVAARVIFETPRRMPTWVGGPEVGTLDDFVVRADGTLLAGECGALHAVRPDGSVAWSTPFPGEPFTQKPTVMATVHSSTVVFATMSCPWDGAVRRVHVYAMSVAGQRLWSHHQPAVFHAPAADSQGNVTFIDEFNTVRSYDLGGMLRWTVDLPGFSSGAPALDADGNLYIGTDGSLFGHQSLWSISPQGSIRWSAGHGPLRSVVITDDELLVAPHWPNRIKAFDMDGSESWAIGVSDFAAEDVLSLGHRGTLYLRTMTEVLALTTRGVVRWRRPAPAGEVAAAAVVDRDERLYVVVKDGVRAIDGESGDTVWEISVPGARRLAFGGEGVLYVQAAGLRLVAIAGSNAVPD